MKKQKILWSMLAIIMAAVLGTGFAACSSDDDDDSGDGIVGTWSGVEDYSRLTLTFNKGGKGSFVITDESPYYKGDVLEKGKFTYVLNEGDEIKGELTLAIYDSYYHSYEYESYRFEKEGNKLYVYGSYTDFVLTKK